MFKLALDSLKLTISPTVWKNDIGDSRYGTLEFHEYYHKTFGVVWPKPDDGEDSIVQLVN